MPSDPATPPTTSPASAASAQRLALGILLGLALAEAILIGMAAIRQPPPRSPAPAPSQASVATATQASKPSAQEPRPTSATALPATLPPLRPLRISPPAVGQLSANRNPIAPAPAPAARSLGPPPIGSLQLPPASAPRQPPAQAAMPPPQVGSLGPNPSEKAAPSPVAVVASTATGKATLKGKPSLDELLQQARTLSGQGDMQGCLECLHRGQEHYPANPQLLAELARSYEIMGLSPKAEATWKQLAAMPAQHAGSFLELAQRRLGIAATTGAAGSGNAGILSLGACSTSTPELTNQGQSVSLGIPIQRRGNARIDPDKVDLDILFFERVNGEKIAQSIADKPDINWLQPPVDWSQGGEEALQVGYFLPSMTPAEIQAHGRRSYHGFVVRLYYENRLQDSVAQPADLLHLVGLPPAAPAPSTSDAQDDGQLLPPPPDSSRP